MSSSRGSPFISWASPPWRSAASAPSAPLASSNAQAVHRVSRRRRPHVFWHEAGHGPVLLLLNDWTASGLAWPSAWLASLERRFR
jgi:hypothetical protein